jgi:hypothetical protein
MEALKNRDGRPSEVVKEAKRTFDPSPISPQSARSWRRFTHKAKTLTSSSQRLQVPPASFDERVIRANQEQSNRDLNRLYDTVWQEDEPDKEMFTSEENLQPQSRSENWHIHHAESKESFASTVPGRPTSTGPAWWTTQQAPSSPLRSRHSAVRPSASAITLDTINSDMASQSRLSALPESPRPGPPHTERQPALPESLPPPTQENQSAPPLIRSTSTSKRNRRSLRITTSSSSLPQPQVSSTISKTSLTPLSPLRSHPTSPLDVTQIPESRIENTIRRVEQFVRPPDTAITYISESAYTPRTDSAIPSPTPASPYANRALPPLPLGATDRDREEASSSLDAPQYAQAIATSATVTNDGQRQLPFRSLHQDSTQRSGLPSSPRRAQHAVSATRNNPAAGQRSTTTTTSHTPRQLPLRSLHPDASQAPGLPASPRMGLAGMAPLRSPAIERTRLTLVTPYQDRFRGRGPPTAGLPTPYSPYFPQTPMTPVTPGLRSREQRKAQEKEERRKALGAEDLVKSDEDLWREGY